jgi:predicted transcriptional regulator
MKYYLLILTGGNMASSRAVKLDDNIYNRLKSLGKTVERTPHWLMKKAIVEYVEREEEAETIRQDTLKRLSNLAITSKTIPFEAIEPWLDAWGTGKEGECPNA